MAAAAARARSGRDRVKTPSVHSDVYTGLLALALLAQVVGAVFLYLDYSDYPQGKNPPDVTASAPSLKRPTPAPVENAPVDQDKDKGPGQ